MSADSQPVSADPTGPELGQAIKFHVATCPAEGSFQPASPRSHITNYDQTSIPDANLIQQRPRAPLQQ